METAEKFSDAKRRLLERFLRGEAARQSWEAPLPERQPGAPIPLAPTQQQIWLHAQMAPGAALYSEPITLHYRGVLDPSVLQRSFDELLRRHEIWRTSFAAVDGQVVQAVHDHLTVPIPFTDLAGLAPDLREQEAQRIATIDAQRPFDLGFGPLMRARLIRLEEKYLRVYITLHRIVFDSVAIYRVVLSELPAIYEAFSQGLPSPFPEPRYQYANYALWQKSLLDNDTAARQMDYWRNTLAGELPVLELPTDKPRPAYPSYRGSMEVFSLTSETTEALKQAAKAEGVTLHMFLLAAFKVLLYRYSGQEDLIVGGATEGRRRAEFDRLLGFFLQTVVLRSRARADLSFRDYLARVKDAVLGALGASDIPFDQLVRELNPKRDLDRHPLFQVLFSIEPPTPAPDPHWDLTQMDVSTGASKFDLSLELDERPEGIIGRFRYSSDLFEPPTIRRMIGNWITLLKGVLKDPTAKLSELPLLTAYETRLIEEWNRTAAPLPPVTIHQLFEERAAETPHAVAVECDGAWMTYRELNQAANRLARTLVEAGAGPGVLVGLCVERGCEMVAAVLALLKTGAAYLPLDPALPQERFRLILNDAQAPIVLTEESRAGQFPAAGARLVFTNSGQGSGANLDLRIAPTDQAYVLYTSGSTGGPKGVEITHSSVVNFLESMRREPGFTRADTLLAVTTLSFDIAALELLLPLTSGGRVVIASHEEVRDPARLTELIREVSPSVMQATPVTWRALLEAGWPGDPRLRILCGGEPMSPDLARHLLPRCAELWNMYGPTETTVWSTVQRVQPGTGPIPIGRPITNTQIYILDQRLEMVPPGVAGELYIGGAGLALGYLRRPELTQYRFVQTARGRLYRTGDLGRWRPDGTLECLGRVDNQVKIRGFRIELEEIEAALLEHPELQAAAVKAWPDSSGDLSLTAYAVSATRPAVRPFLERKLPDYMIPARTIWLDALPLTPTGKIDRNRLPQPEPEAPGGAVQPPATALERRLAEIWESVLDRSNIGLRDNFFDLGGHSLLVAKLLRRIEAEWGVRLSMAAVFQSPTLPKLAELLNSQDASLRSPKVSPIQGNGSRAPLFWMNAGPRYRALTVRLGKDRPFLGVSLDRDEEEALPHNASLREFAERAVRKIRAIRPSGPYHLGGLCVSGLLAYEVAAQLTAAGEEVAQVIMLDALNLDEFHARAGEKLLGSRLRFHWKKLTAGSLEETWRYLSARVKYRANRADTLALWSEKLYQAARRYQPPAYNGRVLMLEPSERLDVAGLAESWAGVAQPGREIRPVDGNHENLLLEPMAADLAATIRQAIEEAEALRRPQDAGESSSPLRAAAS